MFGGPQLDSNSIQDFTDLTGVDRTTRTQGLLTSAEEAFMHSPVSRIKDLATPDTGSTFAYDNWKDSQYYREGLDFKAMSNKDGVVSESHAKIASVNFDGERLRQERLQNMPPGILSSGSRFVGELIGQSLDPINAGANSLSFGVAGIATKAIALAGKAAFAARAGIGAVAGAAALAPQSVLDYSAASYEGQPVSAYDALQGMAINAALVGVLHGAFGPRAIVKGNDLKQAMKTAVNQTESGKFPEISPIIQNGYATARKAEEDMAGDLLKKPMPEGAPKTEAHASNVVGKLKDIEQRAMTGEITDEDVAYHAAVPKTDEVMHAMNLSDHPEAALSNRQKYFMRQMDNGGEEAMLNSRITHHESEIQRISDEMAKVETKAPDRSNLKGFFDQSTKKDLEGHTAKLERAKARLEQIKKGKVEPSKLPEELNGLKSHEKLAKIKEKEAQPTIREHAANELIDETPGEFVKPTELRAKSDEVASYKQNLSYDHLREQAFDRKVKELESAKPDDIAKIEEDFKRLSESGALDDLEQAHLEAIMRDSENHNTFIKALKNMGSCIIGGG